MWLKNAYQSNRLLTSFIVLFFAIQLINNIRQDIAISPWYAYGMYSQKVLSDTGIDVVSLCINGKEQKPSDFMPQVWDKIAQPLILYSKQAFWNQYQFQTDIHRLIPFANQEHFINHITDNDFYIWYCNYIESITHITIRELKWEYAIYSYDQGNWIKTKVIANHHSII